MIADRVWVQRNLGFDPIATPATASTFAFAKAALPSSTPEDLQREIIDFDSEAPSGREFLAFSTATGLSRFTEIPWPKGLAPKTGPKPSGKGSGPLPAADVLVVTWTIDEGHASSRVLTPGKDSRNDYLSYTHNYAAISKKMRKGCPALKAKRLGAYWTTSIGDKKVLVFKSDSHLSQDIKKVPPNNGTLPNYDVWKQIIDEVRPKLIITTGTGGGIGKQFQVGDVMVRPIVPLDGTHWLRSTPYHNAIYKDVAAANSNCFSTATKLFKANSGSYPKIALDPPRIVQTTGPSSSVVTTDFFGFDTSDDFYKLQGLGDLSDMGDAVLGLVASQIGRPLRWISVRNVSDPQIKAEGTRRRRM